MEELESGLNLSGSVPRAWPDIIRAVTWNINRGLELDGVIEFLAGSRADLILLQEADIHARRTGQRNVPREIAQALRMNYIFGREFEELAQGSPIHPAWHGQATLSHLPLSNARILRFQEQSTFWCPRWFIPSLAWLQRRRGGRMALICEITVGDRTLVIYNAHLESRGGDQLRIGQLSEILADTGQNPGGVPVLMAGDFNFDLSRGPADSLMAHSGIANPFASLAGSRTVLKSRNGEPTAIDWMLTRGALAARHPAIHDAVVASDHFPLSLELRLQ